jgi:hypothetical protein
VTLPPNPTKITALLYEPVYKEFTLQLMSLPLKRDAFIELMIERELPELRRDLEGKVNSAKAKRYISGCLKKMGGGRVGELRPLSIAVQKSTAQALRDLAQEHNFPRDAFINRLIALLRSTDYLLKELDLPAGVSDVRGTESMPTSPMKTLEATFYDPLYFLRAACQQRYGCGLYLLGMPWPGFACFLPDDEVPGTEAYIERRAAMALSMGDDEPAKAPAKLPTKKVARS